jgi:hypothetical protein
MIFYTPSKSTYLILFLDEFSADFCTQKKQPAVPDIKSLDNKQKKTRLQRKRESD